jgi:hypothetical protein
MLLFHDALHYWEPYRIAYNGALAAIAVAWLVFTWPHFRPAFTLQSLMPILVLAALANICYCAAYVADILMQRTSHREAWRRHRWALWLAGTLLAIVIENYFIADEIYPFVG